MCLSVYDGMGLYPCAYEGAFRVYGNLVPIRADAMGRGTCNGLLNSICLQWDNTKVKKNVSRVWQGSLKKTLQTCLLVGILAAIIYFRQHR